MDAIFQTLDTIHTRVLKHFTYQTDQEQYGTVEKWVMPSPTFKGATNFVGDCEDFALACRKLCREAGLKTRLVVCAIEGEGHCVLECEGWILCNNQSHVMPRDDLNKHKGYNWLYISGYNPGDDWQEIIG
jgi:predicted transglutaminase-like cysteine proteinase